MKCLLIKLDKDEKLDDVVKEHKDFKDTIIFLCMENEFFEEFKKENKYAYNIYKLCNREIQGPMSISIPNNIYEGISKKSIDNMNYFLDKNFKKQPINIKEDKTVESISMFIPLLALHRDRSDATHSYSSSSNSIGAPKLKME